MSANNVSLFVKNQLPAFYQKEGPRFIAFLEAYYEWLEAEGNTLGYSRDLLTIRDVDTTTNLFLEHFKEKFLNGVQFNSKTSQRDLLKYASELYKSKGSSRSLQLLFLLLFGENSKVVYPGDDVLRASDGTWVMPRYLELSKSDLSFTFTTKTIIGASSGATANVERVDRRNINGKVVDVAYISNVVGLFQYGEKIVRIDTGDITGAPEVVGSLTTIDIVSPGRGFNTGDIIDVVSTSLGQSGKARVTSVGDATGRVSFTLDDGGTGYTTSANVLVSDRVLTFSNKTPANTQITEFVFRETVIQDSANIAFSSSNTTFVTGQTVTANYANGSPKATGKVLLVGNNFVVAQNTSGTFDSTLTLTVNSTAGAVISTVVNSSATGIVVGSNTTTVGLDNITNQFIANGIIRSQLTNISANLVSQSTGAGATFAIGALSDTEQLFLNTDRLAANNVSNVPFMSVALNSADFGFPKLPAGDLNNILSEVLTTGTFTIGTIASLTGVNPGAGYNTNPYVKIVDDNIAPFDRKNLRLKISGVSGTFITGEAIQQQISRDTLVVKVNSPVGTYTAGETVRQTLANSTIYYGEVRSYNPANTTLTIFATDSFNTTASVVGLTSGATATVNNISSGTELQLAKGIVVSSNSTTAIIKRTRFATSFANGLMIYGDDSGSSAFVDDVFTVADSLAMGNNAIVGADAGIANGVITGIEVVDSGFAYFNGETVTLTDPGNIYIGTGIARVLNQGTGQGYWTTSRGFLNNKYLHDSDYYQDFSYEIQSAVSIDRYTTVLKQIAHVAGTKMFGRYVEDVNVNAAPVSTISIEVSTIDAPTSSFDFIAENYQVNV